MSILTRDKHRENLQAHSGGDMTVEADAGVVWRQAKEASSYQKLEEQKDSLPEPPERVQAPGFWTSLAGSKPQISSRFSVPPSPMTGTQEVLKKVNFLLPNGI